MTNADESVIRTQTSQLSDGLPVSPKPVAELLPRLELPAGTMNSPSNWDDAPLSPLMRTMTRQLQLKSKSDDNVDSSERQKLEDRLALKGAAAWLLFHRIVEDWGPKLRNELLTSLLEGALHPSRVQRLDGIMNTYGAFLTFDDFVKLLNDLEVQKNEWLCLVRLVRNISVR